MTRRWFLRASASALVALTAARILPVSALPASGPVHEVIFQDCLRWLRDQYQAWRTEHGAWPSGARFGAALYDQYEVEVTARARVVDPGDHRCLMYRGLRVTVDATLPPWAVRFT